MTKNALIPGQDFPSITLPLLNGGEVELSQPQSGHDWKLILVYRGKHCPLCSHYLAELESVRAQFEDNGIDVIAVSADSKVRAEAQLAEINHQFPVAYDLNQSQMKFLGLHVSGIKNGMDVERPFSEPGLFVVNEEGKLQLVDISNVPFARPSLSNVAGGLKWLRSQSQKFPINGTHI